MGSLLGRRMIPNETRWNNWRNTASSWYGYSRNMLVNETVPAVSNTASKCYEYSKDKVVNDYAPAVGQAYEGSKNMLNANKKEMAEGSLAAATGAGAGVAAVSAAQLGAAASVPTLMSMGATVVSGVGSIMPWWIGPIQAFSVAAPFVVVPAAVGGGIAVAGYGTYKYFNSTSQADEEKQK